MRVLLSAFGFSPYRGSEAAVGWNIAYELAKSHDVTVITGAVRDAPNDYARYVQEHGEVKGLTVEYVEPDGLVKFLDRMHDVPGCWALYYAAYRRWQWLAYRRACVLQRERAFDVVHHLTMIGFREPGYMWKLPVPFVWGPVGGSVNEPIAYSSIYSNAGRLKVLLRNAINWVQKRVLLRPRLAARRAKRIWAVTREDAQTIRTIWGRDCVQMLETATIHREEAKRRFYCSGEVFRLVWSGTHTYGKAMPILILALARLKVQRENVTVDVLGCGSETEKWRKLARENGVADCFSWRGLLPHEEAIGVMNRAHALAFTSVKEGTPHVVLEALSLGLPVICHDACGMGTVVTDRCGVKVPLRTPEESVVGFANAIENIMTHRIDLKSLSDGALARAGELTWAAKADIMSAAYEEVVG